MNYINFLFGYSVIKYISGTFVILGIYLFYTLKYRDKFDYEKEHKLFKDFQNNTFFPINNIDWFAIGLFIIYLGLLAWNIFYKVDARHSDSVGMIYEQACKINQFIGIWVVSGRFMPLAHQEFNILGGILRLLNCSYTFLYSLVFLQFLVTIYLINKILPFKFLWQRLLIILFLTISPAFFQPFSNIIINDRNTLFLLIVVIYNIIYFYRTRQNKNLIFALIFANLSLYVKEPMFLFYSGFALTFLLFKIIENKILLKSIIKKPLDFIKKYPLEIGFLLISSFFLIGYFKYVLLIKQKEFYGFSNKNYFKYLAGIFFKYPLFIVIFATVFLYIKDFKKIKYRNFSISLFMGGLLYALFISSMRSVDNNYYYFFHYYYCIGNLSIMIAVCYYLVDKKKSKIFTIFLMCGIFWGLQLNFLSVLKIVKIDKKRQIQVRSLRENFKLEEGKKYNVFYYGKHKRYGDYRGSVILILLKAITHEKSPIYLYSFDGCYLHHEGKEGDDFRCFKVKSFIFDKYDVVIFERKFFSEGEWQMLVKKYGNKLKQITDYPKFFKIEEKNNVYMMYH